MATLIFFGSMYLVYKALCLPFRAIRHAPRRQRSRPRATPQTVQRSSSPAFTPAATLAALDALQQQRDLLREQLDLIQYALDAAPPEIRRLQLMQKQSTVYSKLAACEQKIGKIVAGH